MGEMADELINQMIDAQFDDEWWGDDGMPDRIPRHRSKRAVIDFDATYMWTDIEGIAHNPWTMDMRHLNNIVKFCKREGRVIADYMEHVHSTRVKKDFKPIPLAGDNYWSNNE
jgi:hypothetical protein